MSRSPHVSAAADRVLKSRGIMENPYLSTLRNGEMSLERFRASQEQFYYAVSYFSRPISALIARMPDPLTRVDLLHNIVEEHGDFHESQFHQNTFKKFLASIGAKAPHAAGTPMGPIVHAFNTTLMGACATDPIVVGVGCLGIIEKAFATISAMIGKAVVDRGWVATGDLVHYVLHAELDIRHADDMFAIIEPRWDDADEQIHIHQGLELGAYAFDRLYRDLLLEAERTHA